MLSVPPLINRSIRQRLLKSAIKTLGEDISPLHFEIISLLEQAGGPLHIAEIGEGLKIARPQMTHLIDRLVELDLVKRQSSPTDRRRIDILLTDKGKTFAEKQVGLIRQTILETMSFLTMADLQDLANSLRKLREIASKL